MPSILISQLPHREDESETTLHRSSILSKVDEGASIFSALAMVVLGIIEGRSFILEERSL
jgi:hypothetical protein